MDQITQNDSAAELLHEIVEALENGLIVVDEAGRIAWLDERTRRTINGGLQNLALPVSRADRAGVDCFFSTLDITIEGSSRKICVLQETGDRKELGHDVVAAIESALSDGSWFARAIVEKVKAWRHAKQPQADLAFLTDREREILALICEGRSDAEMSRILSLSQNTIRNHVASLYRKIGVNRRSAAVIWARERAITSQEFMQVRSHHRWARSGQDK